jgi:hypothetical protein
MIWYVSQLSFDQRQPFPCTQKCLHPPHFPKHPTMQLRAHHPTKTACMRTCAVPKLHQQVHGCRVCNYIHLGSPHTKAPARPMLCSHARSSERMRRDKGLRRACCEAPVDLMTAGIAGATAAATLLNALVGCRPVGFVFSPHLHSSTNLCVLSPSARSLEGRTTCVNHKLTFLAVASVRISPSPGTNGCKKQIVAINISNVHALSNHAQKTSFLLFSERSN